MSRVDREALGRALEIDGRKVKRGDDWEDVARSAAYHCQIAALHLRPWENPPMFAFEDDPRDAAAWALRCRLIAAGLSVFEPNPPAALEAAIAQQRARARHLAANGVKPNTRQPAHNLDGDHVRRG